jgi:uncharacterized phiE125 gp8 family phage protein
MGLLNITPPPIEPVDISEFTRYLRVTEINGGDDQYLLESLLKAARQHLDGADGYLSRAFITQTWDLTLDRFPYGRTPILLPLCPVQSVTSVSYLDATGASQTWTNTLYALDRISEPARLSPIYGGTYPTTQAVANAVTVRFVAGYGARGDLVPEPIRLAIMALAAHWYENREAVLVGVTDALPLPMHVDALLASYRIWPVCAEA